jgi:hypothetical protein
MAGGKHRKGHKKTRKMRGGMFSGMGEAINAGNYVHEPVNGSAPVDSRTGAEMKDIYAGGDSAAMVGGRRYRKSKKSTRKSRKGKSKKVARKTRKTRKMKGGMWSPGNVNGGNVGYGYSGPQQGVIGGIAPASGYAANVGGAPMGADGTRSA